MFRKSSTAEDNNTGHGRTVNIAADKLNDLYGGGSNVPRLDGPEKFRRSQKGHMHDGGNDFGNGVTNNGIYGDDGDLISSQGYHAPSVGRVQDGSSRSLRDGRNWSGAQTPALSNIHLSVSAEATKVATQWLPHIGLGSPAPGEMRNGLKMARLA